MAQKANIALGLDFTEALRELPSLSVRKICEIRSGRDTGVDLVLDLEVKGEPYELWVQTECGEVHPKKALDSVRKLKDGSRHVLLAASSLSLESRELLREHGVGYWDESGSLFLELPNALYSIEREPLPQPRVGREPRKVFKGKTAQVVHTLLLAGERDWKVTELAEKAGVSAYTSQKVLEHLEDRLWVSKRGRGPQTLRRLKDPGGLLDAWARDYEIDCLHELKLHQYAKDTEEQHSQLCRLLLEVDCDWAVTLEHGASFWASNLTRLPSSMSVWVPDDVPWRKIIESSDFKMVERGENLRLLVTKEAVPFLGVSTFDSLHVASPIQLYLDLFNWPKRGREQAEHLRKERLRF